MRLLTHNFIACLRCEAFPLEINASEVKIIPLEFDTEFTRCMLARIEWSYFLKAYQALQAKHDIVHSGNECGSFSFPESLEAADLSDDSELLHALHYAMNMVDVKSGVLRCSACETTYEINDFIPNFVLEGGK
ncbi:unnamed protein product [Phytomonas sp. Hart1]|nr:unnamed protein product [Phytomonas sp. Hart1]|eukprot:CCW71242.1 unnamed protein product [Phytomonas sp. isolate Hart1]